MSKYVSIDHAGIAFLRTDFPDIYFDFPVMAEKALAFWPNMEPEDSEGIRFIADKCTQIAEPLAHLTRIYVTTEYLRPHLIVVDKPQRVIDHMFRVFEDIPWKKQLLGEYLDCIMVWVFQGTQLIRDSPINPGALAQLVTAFYKDNLVSVDHVRLNWNFTP